MIFMQIKHIILHLSLIYDIGSKTINRLITHFGRDHLLDVYSFTQQDFMRGGFSEYKARLLVEGLQDKRFLEQELIEIKQFQAEFVTVLCEEYPILLKQIEVPPAVLYFQGDVSLFQRQKMLACVGARKAHSYVQDCLNSIVVPLIQDNWVVVSGGALGADTYAHKAALNHDGKTIVVVGSGLYHQYPPRNKKLFEQVVATGGLIVSAFPIKQMPEARCFPMRNRIISGLSAGCLVLQAASKSGALITAEFALEQGREVFAVPGPIYDPLSAGCHDLIKQGAKLVNSTQDILDELVAFDGVAKNKPVEVQQTCFDTKKSKATKHKAEAADVSVAVDEYERLILKNTVLPVSTEDLLNKIAIEPSILHEKLFGLSLDGKISQDCMGLWKRI